MNLSKLQEIVGDRGAWRATVRGVTKSQIWLSDSTRTRSWNWKGNTSPASWHRGTYFCLCNTQTSLLAVAWVRYFEKHCQGDGSLSVLRACHLSDFKDLNCKNPAVPGQPVPVLDSCRVLQFFSFCSLSCCSGCSGYQPTLSGHRELMFTVFFPNPPLRLKKLPASHLLDFATLNQIMSGS